MIEPGSMIKIDYTASIVETEDTNGELGVFDTTLEEVARKEAIYRSDKVYEPMLIVIDKGWIPFGLEKKIQRASIGESFETIISCEEAFGPKDPSKIKLVARREFQKLNINPAIGDRITIGSQTGTVLSVTSSRVRMDYNHVLAGKDIHYAITIHEQIEGDENKIRELIKRRLPGANLQGMEIRFGGDLIEVSIPEQARFFEYVQFAKAEVAKDIGEILTGFRTIVFVEHFPISSEK